MQPQRWKRGKALTHPKTLGPLFVLGAPGAPFSPQALNAFSSPFPLQPSQGPIQFCRPSYWKDTPPRHPFSLLI